MDEQPLQASTLLCIEIRCRCVCVCVHVRSAIGTCAAAGGASDGAGGTKVTIRSAGRGFVTTDWTHCAVGTAFCALKPARITRITEAETGLILKRSTTATNTSISTSSQSQRLLHAACCGLMDAMRCDAHTRRSHKRAAPRSQRYVRSGMICTCVDRANPETDR